MPSSLSKMLESTSNDNNIEVSGHINGEEMEAQEDPLYASVRFSGSSFRDSFRGSRHSQSKHRLEESN